MTKQKDVYSIDDIIAGELGIFNKPSITEVITAKEYQESLKKRKKTLPILHDVNDNTPQEELKEGVYHITLEGLPKWSTNNMYAGGAFYSRKKIKDKYKKMVKEQFNKVVRFKCICVYEFFFKSRALDSSNCSGMAKMIEDCILPSDSYRMVGGVYFSSAKGDRDYVIIHIFPPESEELIDTIRRNAQTFSSMRIDSHNRVIQ